MPRALSGSLKERLRQIPATVDPTDGEGDLQELVSVAVSRVEGRPSLTLPAGTPGLSVVDAEIVAGLEATISESRLPMTMPPALRAGLREIPNRVSKNGRQSVDQLPWWIADSRWAMAACCMLTAGLTLLAGDASARFQELQESSTRIQASTRTMTSDLGEQVAEQIYRWVPEAAPGAEPALKIDPPPSAAGSPAAGSSAAGTHAAGSHAARSPAAGSPAAGTSWIAATADSGRTLWSAAKDRAGVHADPWIGRAQRQKEILELWADAWLGFNPNEPATSSRERLHELKLRTEEALKLVLPDDRPADHDTKGKTDE